MLSRSLGTRLRLVRCFSTTSPVVNELKSKIQALAAQEQGKFTDLKKKYAHVPIGAVTIEMAMGGGRGIKAMVTDTSDLDAFEGIRYRGMTLPEVNSALPKAFADGQAGLPEAAFWLLLTGEVPSAETTKAFNAELHRRSELPADVIAILDNLPITMHPMTQLSIGMLALQPYSKFSKKYSEGTMKKSDYWENVLEDSITLVAQIPIVASRIYRRTFHDSVFIASDPSLDWAGNYANMLGVNNDELFKEATRLYLMLHADHEGGNVSAHATHLVGSALADPYYSWAAGICGLAGPLHGLANQECLKWLEKCMSDHVARGITPSVETVTKYAQDTLAKGRVIPGYGHAVLRKTDPRYMLEREFCLKNLKEDPLVDLCAICFDAIPPVLEATGKVKNPNPNVDAHSGVIMQHYGLKESDYYTVVFAVSRAIGVMSQLVWSRVMGMPIERPKSVTLDFLHKQALQASTK